MKLASIFTDNMILQRDMPIKVFGSGDGDVNISFLGKEANTIGTGGRWCVTLPAQKAGGPYRMDVTMDGKTVTLINILIGDVFIAAGQSNMEMPLFKTEYGFEEAKSSNNSCIRYFTVPRRYKPGYDTFCWHFAGVYNHDTPWRSCCEDSALTFSAIGHYFAKYINEEIGVPVGIISCNWGGKRIETFIAKEYFYDCNALKTIIEEYDDFLANLDMYEYDKKFEVFADDISKYILNRDNGYIDTVRKLGLRAAAPLGSAQDMPIPDKGPYDSLSPATLWDSMYSDIVPYGVKAMLWYQGEANGYDIEYKEKYLTFLKCIREKFGCEMDVYAVELAPWIENIAEYMKCPMERFVTKDNWAFLREQQYAATVEGDKNYLVTTQELGDIYDIHPSKKKEVARRLALKALKYTYGLDIKADQPVYKSVEFNGEKAYITLDNADGLYGITADVNMYIAGIDKVLHRAQLEILPDNRLCVYCNDVKTPVLVRYGFDFYYFGRHLYNDAGLPLAPFRTDADGI